MREATSPALAFVYDRGPASAAARLSVCVAYAERQRWPVAGAWTESGEHVARPVAEQPAYRKLLASLLGEHRDGDRDVVLVVTDWDRLHPDPAQQFVACRQIHDAGGWTETTAGDTSLRLVERHRPRRTPRDGRAHAYSNA
ncbi:recombinase family protein [Streptomyces sp. ICBB 8177]|uniref:recombinase family protein n=1 Tax=Streptomyces sp. ICBB 8177 TaxID=563922 RepID=UPI000D67625E|nr:recombinase family protein [Streptomyces sp. ICBB 8177]PWI45366.1 hypothetical protein CK485_04305 [Streptomyces sp. ICBB 8177]